MSRAYAMKGIFPAFVLAGLFCIANAQALPPARDIATEILAHSNITLADFHVSGVKDSATAKDNITQVSGGKPAQRSAYETAPGGTVELSQQMLWGLRMIADKFKIRVSEIAGGSHSANSRHYVGVAFDLDMIDGINVSASNPAVVTVKTMCKNLGATEILGPGDAGHSGHVHCAWPRP